MVTWEVFDLVVQTSTLCLDFLKYYGWFLLGIDVFSSGFLTKTIYANDVELSTDWWSRKLNFCWSISGDCCLGTCLRYYYL